MKHRVHLAWFAVLIALGVAPVYGAAPASVSGLVRDSAGTPQMGAVVQLLRPDLSVVATVYTDSQGHFQFNPVAPGHYALKAMADSFLPSLRENLRVRSASIVNLTLNTLYEAIQWLPSKPRASSAQRDDWTWTLRSAADRPLLRWLENGPLVVVSDGSGARPKLKARIMATGAAGSFGEDGERYSAAVEDTPTGSRALLARVDFAPDSTAGMESMLGFRQDLGMAGSVQSVAAISIHPDMGAGDSQGLSSVAMDSRETMQFGPALDAEVGAAQVLAHMGGGSPETMAAAFPYAQVNWSSGNDSVGYRMATLAPAPAHMMETGAGAVAPRFSARDGRLVIERGMHQEISWARHTDASGMTMVLYADKVENPALEALNTSGAAGEQQLAGPVKAAALLDGGSGLLHAAGPNFSGTGFEASFDHRLPGGNNVHLSYANGDALVMPALPQRIAFREALAAARPRHAQMYTVSFSGTLDGTKTRWTASYRWQPDSTVTAVAPYSMDATAPYLNIYIRQPIRLGGNGMTGFEALIDVSNLLAEGYRPYFLNDGSVLVFAQGRRTIRGGLAFTF